MSTFTAPAPVRVAVPAGVATTLVAAGLTTLFAHDWGEILVVVPPLLVVGALVFGLVVPRALRKESRGGTALLLSVPAVLLAAPAFWSGLPLVLGVAGMVVGSSGKTAATGSGKSIAAMALGAIAALFYLSVYLYEGIAGHTGFLLS